MTKPLTKDEVGKVRRLQNTSQRHKEVFQSVVIRYLVIALIGLSVSSIFLATLTWHFVDQARTTRELIYIKLAPSGGYEISRFMPKDPQPFYRSTIDGLLERFVQDRYAVRPETIAQDYSDAAIFMNSETYGQFTGNKPGQFNAVAQVNAVMKDPASFQRVNIHLDQPVDYYDAIPTQNNVANSAVIRSRLFVTRTDVDASGQVTAPPKHQIVSIEWHLLNKTILAQQSDDWLRKNPVGIEILKYGVRDDPAYSSDDQVGKSNSKTGALP